MAYSKDDRKQVFMFFENVLSSTGKTEIHYECLRGYISEAPEVVRKYVRRECKGENFLQYFKKRKNYFVVNDNCFVSLKRSQCKIESSDDICETKAHEFDDEYFEEAYNTNDFESYDTSESNSVTSSILSRNNSVTTDDSCNTSNVNEEIKKSEEDTLRYFCKKLEDGEERPIDSIILESKKAKRYLKKHMKNDTVLFFRRHPEIFCIDDNMCVSLVSNPFLRKISYQPEVQSVGIKSSAYGEEVAEETISDFKKQTVENLLYCANFFAKIMKKSNPIHIERLSGYLSTSRKCFEYLKVNYHHFSDFFCCIPQLFIFDKNNNTVSLSNDYARLLKEAKKLYSKSKNEFSSMPIHDATKKLFSISSHNRKQSTSQALNLLEIENSDPSEMNLSNEDDSSLLMNPGMNDNALLTTEYSILEEPEISNIEVSKIDLKNLGKCINMLIKDSEEGNKMESQITPISVVSNIVQKCTVPEVKPQMSSKIESISFSVSSLFNFTSNKVQQTVQKLYTLIDTDHESEISHLSSREDLLNFVDILYTLELLCLEKVEKEHILKLSFEYESVKFFTEILEKNPLNVGCGISSLKGSLGQASHNVLFFMKQLYRGEKFQDFLESHEEFIINSNKFVKLSPSYKKSLHKRSLNYEKNTACKKSYNLGSLYNSHWFQVFIDAYECFFEIFCFLMKKEKHLSKISRLSGIIPKLSPAQQDFINSFCGKELVEKISELLNNFRIFSYPSDDYVAIDSTLHIPFLEVCVTQFMYLLKDEETRLSDFCYLLNDCSNNDDGDNEFTTRCDKDCLRCDVVKSVENFLSISPFFAYQTLPVILNDDSNCLFNLMKKQIFSFGVVKMLEECNLFHIKDGEIRLKNENKNETVDCIVTDINSLNCQNGEISQGKTDISHLVNDAEDIRNTTERDKMEKYTDTESKNSESAILNFPYIIDRNGCEIENSKSTESNSTDLCKIDANIQLEKNIEEKVLENEDKNNNAMNMYNDTKSERENKTMLNDGNFMSDSINTLSKKICSVPLNSNEIEDNLDRKSENTSSKEIDTYDVRLSSHSKMVLNHKLHDKYPEMDSFCNDSVPVSDNKEDEINILIPSSLSIHSAVQKVQKVANIEALPIKTCQEKSSLKSVSLTSAKHTFLNNEQTGELETKEHFVMSENEIEESESRSCDLELNSPKLDFCTDSNSTPSSNEKCMDTIHNNPPETSANEMQSDELDKKLSCTHESETEFISKPEFLSCNSKLNNKKLTMYTDCSSHVCDVRKHTEAVYDNLLSEKYLDDDQSEELENNGQGPVASECTIDSFKLQPQLLNSDLKVINKEFDSCTGSDTLAYSTKESTEIMHASLLSENDTKSECIEIIKGSTCDVHYNGINYNYQEMLPENLSGNECKVCTLAEDIQNIDSNGLSVIPDMKSDKSERSNKGRIINQISDNCHSDEVIQDRFSSSLEKNIFIRRKGDDFSKISSFADNNTSKNEDDNVICEKSTFHDFYYVDTAASEKLEMVNNSTKNSVNDSKLVDFNNKDPSTETFSFSEDSSSKTSSENNDKNSVSYQNLNPSFFQPLSTKVVLLTLDSCIAETTINGDKKFILCLKSNFHCDQHTDCQKCFDSLAIGDKISCYVPPTESLGNMCFSFMFCKEVAIVDEECQLSNILENTKLTKGASNARENLQLTKDTCLNDISKLASNKFCTQPEVHLVTDKDRMCYMVEEASQVECSEFIQHPPVKELAENGCQTFLSGRLRSYPSVVEKECQVKYSLFSKDRNTQTVHKYSNCECQTMLSGEVKSCTSLIEKECQVKCSTSSQNTQTIRNLSESECQTELSGKIKCCPAVSQKECQVECKMLSQSTQTLNRCNEEVCQTDISGKIKSCSDISSLSCQTVISGQIKKCVNLINESCQTSDVSTLINQTTQTDVADSFSENRYTYHTQVLDWASTDASMENKYGVPEVKSLRTCDASCQTLSTGPVMIIKFHFS